MAAAIGLESRLKTTQRMHASWCRGLHFLCPQRGAEHVGQISALSAPTPVDNVSYCTHTGTKACKLISQSCSTISNTVRSNETLTCRASKLLLIRNAFSPRWAPGGRSPNTRRVTRYSRRATTLTPSSTFYPERSKSPSHRSRVGKP